MTQTKSSVEHRPLQGFTLHERLQCLLPSSNRSSSAPPSQTDRQSLAMCRSWFEAQEWSRFLRSNHLSEKDLRDVVHFRCAGNDTPAWLDSLATGMQFVQNGNFQPVFQKTVAENLALPLVAFAWRNLRKRLRLLEPDLFSPSAAFALRRSLLRRLVFSGRFAIAWEVSATLADTAITPKLQNEQTLQKHFFARGIAQELSTLLSRYPVLARIWFIQIGCWTKFIEDFAQQALGFVGNLRRRSPNRYRIESVNLDLSDPHKGNRTVLKVRFRDAGEMYYKPRSGRQELAWFTLLAQLNAAGFVTPFRILDVHCCGDHCWMEAVRSDYPRNGQDLIKRSFRIGALMYLVHLLRGVDFHAENVVGAGSQPIIVDCETFLHPTTFLPKATGDEDASIRRTGFLPRNVNDASDSESEGTGGSPGLFGALKTPRQYVEYIVSGFSAMHHFLASKPTRLRYIESALLELSNSPARKIYRPSLHYYYTLESSLRPSLLRNGLTRSIFLWASCLHLAGAFSIVAKEVAALENLDMPYFEGNAVAPQMDLSSDTFQHSIRTIQKMLR